MLLAVERLLDMGHEPALRCLERLRKRLEQVEEEGRPSIFRHNVRIVHRFLQATDASALDTTSPACQISENKNDERPIPM